MKTQVAPEGSDHERVIDLAAEQEAFELRDGYEDDFGDLGTGVLNGTGRLDAGRIKAVKTMHEQRGIRIHRAERLRAARASSGRSSRS